jgi:predicted acylesterase/phospholipase RssA
MNFISVLFLVGVMLSSATEQLSFSGGGAFGAVEIGIIKKLHESHSIRYDNL